MQRKALIIGAPADDIPGVTADVVNYKNFLMSAAGGAWYEDEIKILTLPSPTDILLAQLELQLSDYSLCIFGGHGGFDRSSQKTVIEINPTKKIDIQELNTGAKRHTVIVDACRTHFTPLVEEVLRKAEAAVEQFTNMDYARRKYEEHLAKCPAGIAKMYSCADDEGAVDSAKGGLFSYSLLKNARVWSQQQSTFEGILEVHEAFNMAQASVKHESGGRQNPEGMFLRTGPRFPFAVHTR